MKRIRKKTVNLPVYDAGQIKERETQVNGWLSALQW